MIIKTIKVSILYYESLKIGDTSVDAAPATSAAPRADGGACPPPATTVSDAPVGVGGTQADKTEPDMPPSTLTHRTQDTAQMRAL